MKIQIHHQLKLLRLLPIKKLPRFLNKQIMKLLMKQKLMKRHPHLLSQLPMKRLSQLLMMTIKLMKKKPRLLSRLLRKKLNQLLMKRLSQLQTLRIQLMKKKLNQLLMKTPNKLLMKRMILNRKNPLTMTQPKMKKLIQFLLKRHLLILTQLKTMMRIIMMLTQFKILMMSNKLSQTKRSHRTLRIRFRTLGQISKKREKKQWNK